MKRFLLFSFLLIFIASTLSAEEQVNQFFQTAEKYKDLIVENEGIGKLPRASDKNVMSMIDILSDQNNYFSSRGYTQDDLNLLMEMSNSLNSIIMSYSLYGLKQKIEGVDPSKSAQIALDVMNENSVLFQDEIFKLLAFNFQCMAKQVPLVSKFVQSLKPEELTDIRINGLREFRLSIYEAYLGALGNINNSDIQFEYRYLLLESLSETSLVFVEILPIEYRLYILNLVENIQAQTTPGLNPNFQMIKKAMMSTKCEGLCGI